MFGHRCVPACHCKPVPLTVATHGHYRSSQQPGPISRSCLLPESGGAKSGARPVLGRHIRVVVAPLPDGVYSKKARAAGLHVTSDPNPPITGSFYRRLTKSLADLVWSPKTANERTLLYIQITTFDSFSPALHPLTCQVRRHGCAQGCVKAPRRRSMAACPEAVTCGCGGTKRGR